ncbi:MAG: type II toxin-antitoxin system RelE/ParE family toxin [Promethearchaeia archaeon]
MVTIKWTEPAKEDLKEIIDYLSQDSSQYGEYFRYRVFEEIENIRDFPLMGRINLIQLKKNWSDKEIKYPNISHLLRIFLWNSLEKSNTMLPN